MKSKKSIERDVGMEDMGEKKDSQVIKAVEYKRAEIRELKGLLEKSEKLQEFYTSIFKMEGMSKELMKLGNYRFKTAKWFSPKSDEMRELEKLEEVLNDFMSEYKDRAVNVSRMLERYNDSNKKALKLFKERNEQLISQIEILNSE